MPEEDYENSISGFYGVWGNKNIPVCIGHKIRGNKRSPNEFPITFLR